MRRSMQPLSHPPLKRAASMGRSVQEAQIATNRLALSPSQHLQRVRTRCLRQWALSWW